MDCQAACHADVKTDKPKYGVTPHLEAGVTCNDCHNSAELGEFHTQAFKAQTASGDEEGEPAAAAAEETVAIVYDDEFCFGCHLEENPHPSWEALAELTADSEEAKAIGGGFVNPHAPHPEGSTAEALTCAMCHEMHGRPAGVSGCYGCHHSYTLQSCDDCHVVTE